VHVCGTPSQTPAWLWRLDFTVPVHFVEGCDGSASIDVSFIHVNFHRETQIIVFSKYRAPEVVVPSVSHKPRGLDMFFFKLNEMNLE
jgi:hypothetical protein